MNSPAEPPVGGGRPPQPLALDQLLRRAGTLAVDGRRRLLGITGAPGSGKSTLSTAIVEGLGDRAAVLVGMDGFHLANAELVRLGRRDRKGAADTFDVDGFVHLLGRLREQTEAVVYAPVFNRLLEESVGSAVPVVRDVPLVVVEGNYLLLQSHGWSEVREQLDEVWFLDVPALVRTDRLVQRRASFGHTVEQSAAWVHDVDEVNASEVEATRGRADLTVRLTTAIDGAAAP